MKMLNFIDRPYGRSRIASIVLSPSTYLVLLLSLSAPSSKSQELDTYSINYMAKAGIAAAYAKRSLSKIAENSYQLLNTLNVTLAGQSVTEIKEISEIVLSPDQKLIPNSYSKEQSGLKDTLEHITYNWNKSIATVSNTDQSAQINLEEDTYDQLSHQIVMRENFIKGIEEFSYSVIDQARIEKYRYSILGQENISTPLGDFLSIKIERTQPDNGNRSIVFWLSTEWAGVLLRMNQVINGEIEVTLEIQDGFVNGKSITSKKKF